MKRNLPCCIGCDDDDGEETADDAEDDDAVDQH